MRYIVTLNNVKRSDLESLGFRAIDLGILREKRLNIPLTFVINNQAFEDFLAENGLRAKIEKAYKNNKKPSEAYQGVTELFNKAIIPKEVEAEIFEAYESLAVDPGATASTIVADWDYPFVSLIRSPSYLLSTEDAHGIMQNIRGKESLVAGLKKVWASVFSPESIDYRKRAGIGDSFGVGVLVQKMKKVKQAALSYSCSDFDEKIIIVKSFLGLLDYGLIEEVQGKDLHEVDADTLMIKKAQINVQEYSIVRNLETNELAKQDLREQGSRQKLDDKQIYEVARITKRAKSFMGRDLKLYMGVKDAYTYIFLASRMVAEPKKIVEEKEDIKLTIDDEGEKTMEHKRETTAGKQEGELPLDMPDIITKEEAKEELLKEEPKDVPEEEPEEEPEEDILKEEMEEVEEDLKEKDKEEERRIKEEEFDKILERDLEFLELIQREEKEESPEEVEQEGDKELNLLEEVLQIKEILERMEEHATNNNKPAYDQEARKLRNLVSKVRRE